MAKFEQRVLQKMAYTGLTGVGSKHALSECFHENTKLTPVAAIAYGEAIQAFYRSPLASRLVAGASKIFSLMDRRGLETATASSDLERAIAARRSERSFTGEAMTIAEVSRLLQFSYGVTDKARGLRAVPSAGALYPLELYVAALNIDSLARGIYHYNANENYLDVCREGDPLPELEKQAWLEGIDAGRACAVIVISAIFRRASIKYQDRGYRMVLFEAGEVAQNLSLLAVSMGLGTCLVGGFLDDGLGTLFEIDGVDEAVLLPIVIGRRSTTTRPADGSAW